MEVLPEENLHDWRAGSESEKSDVDENYDYADDYGHIEKEAVITGPIPITEETLKRIEHELGLIKLCWPEVDLGDSPLSQLPESYRTNTDKEKLVFCYAENFRKQYHTIYKDRKPLLMVCDNECGIKKFVSTSIRPSTLPYPELSTWQGCANFVRDHLDYEAPKKPLSMPLTLCSPTWLMSIQRGNNFEYATFLVSLLLGKGYNAFVVSGYASREQVLCDMSMRTCPYLPKPEEPEPPPEPIDTTRYRMKSPPNFRSQFLLEMEAKEARIIEEELEHREKERLKMLREQERPPPDDYWGNRVHSWVVILPQVGGPRDDEIEKPLFIEPNSGMSYLPEDRETSLLYHGIESIWNDKNYWVNMQMCTEGCYKIDWDLMNTKLWEHLLPGEPWTMREVDNVNEGDEDIDMDVSIELEKHLDMPFSYVKNIEIQSLDFERRYPNGTKTVYFKKTKVDFYAPYVQMDGLVCKITFYEDYEYKFPTQLYEKYSNRADGLVESRKYLDTFVLIDYYKRGRIDACKEHRYSTNGHDGIDEERTLDFYDAVRADGLSKIETGPLYFTQHYIGRKDFLYYRHVEYSIEKERSVRRRIVSKIIEKYHRNESVPANDDIAIREFCIAENEIRLKYHYEKNRITRATKRFVKPPATERGEPPTFNPDLIQGYYPDPLLIPRKQLTLYYELEKQLKEEAQSLLFVRDAEYETSLFFKNRNSEYSMPKLVVSVFDRNRNEEAKAGMLAKEELLKAQSEREVELEVDYLGPYLARLGNPSQLTKSQAAQVRQECLNDLKKMLVDRANHISQSFEECNKELNKVQTWLTQTEGNVKENQEELLNLTNDINFHLHTLDVRLHRHCDLVPERFAKMLSILRADKRLSELYE